MNLHDTLLRLSELPEYLLVRHSIVSITDDPKEAYKLRIYIATDLDPCFRKNGLSAIRHRLTTKLMDLTAVK